MLAARLPLIVRGCAARRAYTRYAAPASAPMPARREHVCCRFSPLPLPADAADAADCAELAL